MLEILSAYYEEDEKEYGYDIRISMEKSFKFLREKNKDLEDKYWNIHHYVGTDNPKQRMADQNLKEIDIAIVKITKLKERLPELKTYIDDKLLKIVGYKPTEGLEIA
jgi:hypothetical protein